MIHRDPGIAAVAAFVVWGLGHIYAGKFVAGFLLFFAQAALIGMLVLTPAVVAATNAAAPPATTGEVVALTWGVLGLVYLGAWFWQVQAAYRAVEQAAREAEEAARREREQQEQLARLGEAIRRSS